MDDKNRLVVFIIFLSFITIGSIFEIIGLIVLDDVGNRLDLMMERMDAVAIDDNENSDTIGSLLNEMDENMEVFKETIKEINKELDKIEIFVNTKIGKIVGDAMTEHIKNDKESIEKQIERCVPLCGRYIQERLDKTNKDTAHGNER